MSEHSPVPTSGIFDNHLSPVDIRHVVRSLHVYKYWPRVRSVNVTQVKAITSVRVLNKSTLVCAFLS
jgi:hypothetical protein